MLVFVFSCCSSDLIHSTVPSISVSVGCMVVDWIHGFQCHIYIQYRGTKRIEAQLKTQPSLHFSLLALSAHKFHIYIISCYFIHAIRKYVHIYSFAIFFFFTLGVCVSLSILLLWMRCVRMVDVVVVVFVAFRRVWCVVCAIAGCCWWCWCCCCRFFSFSFIPGVRLYFYACNSE